MRLKNKKKRQGIIRALLALLLMASIFASVMLLSSAAEGPWLDKSEVEVPEDYAYSFAVVGDPQYLTYYDTFEDGNNSKGYLYNIYKWIADNKDTHGIEFVLGMGDITHADNAREWAIAKSAIGQLDGVVPYTQIRGNHDNRTKLFDEYIGAGTGYLEQDTLVACYEVKGETNTYSTRARNTIHEYKIGSVSYLVLALDCGVQDPVLEWANEWVAKDEYKNHKVIVTTHSYTSAEGEHEPMADYESDYNESVWATDGSRWSANAKVDESQPFNGGAEIWDKLVKRHANITAVICGHVLVDNIVRVPAIGNNGNVVQQIVVNPQDIDDNSSPDSFTGMVALFYCTADGKIADVRYYSTVEDKYYGEKSQFSMRFGAREWAKLDGMSFTENKLFGIKGALKAFPATIEAELKYTRDTSDRVILSTLGAATPFSLYTVANQDTIGISYGSKSVVFESIKNADTGYHSYAFAFDGDNVHAYVDGALAETVSHGFGDITSSGAVSFSLGGTEKNNNSAYFKNGAVRSLMLYSDVRSSKEIKLDVSFMDETDADALVCLDLSAAKHDGRDITNYADGENPLCLKRAIMSDGEGMTFTQTYNLRTFKKPSSEYPKTIQFSMKYELATTEYALFSSYYTGTVASEWKQFGIFVSPNTGYFLLYYKGPTVGSRSYKFDALDTSGDGKSDFADGSYHAYSITIGDTSSSLYVDGELLQTVNYGWTYLTGNVPSAYDAVPNSFPYSVGGDVRNNGGNQGAFKTGAIKWLSVYSDIRSLDEIKTDIKGVFTQDENAMIMVDLAAVGVYDDVPNYADFTNPLYLHGKNSSTSRAQISALLSAVPKTLETVIRYNAPTTSCVIAGNYCSTSYTGWNLSTTTTGSVKLSIYDKTAATTQEVTFTKQIFAADQVYYRHIAVSFDGARAYLYVNGVLVDTASFAYTEVDWWYALPMCIGGDQTSGNANYFRGKMKSIALYSDYRTSEEIAESFKYGPDGADAGLLAAYDFNGKNSATIVKNEKLGGAPMVLETHAVSGDVYTDIADFGAYENSYLLGYEQPSTPYREISQELWDITVKGPTADNVGIEFRMKSKESKDQIRALMATGNNGSAYKSTLWAFANVRLGNSFIEINLPNDLSSFGIRSAYSRGSMYYYKDGVETGVVPYEDGAEYVFRITRTALSPDIDNGYGAKIRIYIGKINPETNMPENGWDSAPVYETLALHARNVETAQSCGISVQAGHIGHSTRMPHTLIYSSNKYVGVKTVVGNEQTVNKVLRGADFTLGSLNADGRLHIGWSLGADSFSNTDFYPAGTKLQGVNEPRVYRALTMALSQSKTATLGFTADDTAPVLKWDLRAGDALALLDYFGEIKIGYLLRTSENGNAQTVELCALNSMNAENYSYSLLYSDIQDYDLAYRMVAYAEINGTKYYAGDIDGASGISLRELAESADTVNYNEKQLDLIKAIINAPTGIVGFVPRHSITLYSSLIYNIYIPKHKSLTSVQINGEAVELDTLPLYGDYYLYKVEFPASEAGRTVTLGAEFSTDIGARYGEYSFSVLKYARSLINNPTSSDATVAAAKSMLAYIKSAYVYFDCEDSEEVGAIIDAIIGENYSASVTEGTAVEQTDGLNGATFVLKATPALRFYLSGEYSQEGYVFKVGGSVAEAEVSADGTYVDVSLFAYRMCDTVSYEIIGTDIKGGFNLQSYYDYVRSESFTDEKKAEVIDLTERFYIYCQMAAAYRNEVKG